MTLTPFDLKPQLIENNALFFGQFFKETLKIVSRALYGVVVQMEAFDIRKGDMRVICFKFRVVHVIRIAIYEASSRIYNILQYMVL